MRKDLLSEPVKAGSPIDYSFQVPGLATGSIAYFRDLGNGILFAQFSLILRDAFSRFMPLQNDNNKVDIPALIWEFANPYDACFGFR